MSYSQIGEDKAYMHMQSAQYPNCTARRPAGQPCPAQHSFKYHERKKMETNSGSKYWKKAASANMEEERTASTRPAHPSPPAPAPPSHASAPCVGGARPRLPPCCASTVRARRRGMGAGRGARAPARRGDVFKPKTGGT
jgi:hypothetical protein